MCRSAGARRRKRTESPRPRFAQHRTRVSSRDRRHLQCRCSCPTHRSVRVDELHHQRETWLFEIAFGNHAALRQALVSRHSTSSGRATRGADILPGYVLGPYRDASIKHLDVEIGHALGVPAAHCPERQRCDKCSLIRNSPVRSSLRHVGRSHRREGGADYCRQIRTRNLSSSDCVAGLTF